MKVLFRRHQDYTIIYRLYRNQYHGFRVRYQISNISKIANISNIANIPIVANIAIITKVFKFAKISNFSKLQNHDIANIDKVVKIAKLDKINKIHKCAINSTNVYQIPLMHTKIPLSLTSSSVID